MHSVYLCRYRLVRDALSLGMGDRLHAIPVTLGLSSHQCYSTFDRTVLTQLDYAACKVLLVICLQGTRWVNWLSCAGVGPHDELWPISSKMLGVIQGHSIESHVCEPLQLSLSAFEPGKVMAMTALSARILE